MSSAASGPLNSPAFSTVTSRDRSDRSPETTTCDHPLLHCAMVIG